MEIRPAIQLALTSSQNSLYLSQREDIDRSRQIYEERIDDRRRVPGEAPEAEEEAPGEGAAKG